MTTVPVKALAELAEFVQYGYTASASEQPIGPHFLRITDIVSSQIEWTSVPYCKIDEKAKSRFLLEPGDIVIARTGATVGYAKLIRDNPESVFASYLVRIRVDRNLADPGYVGRVVESDIYKQFVRSHVSGSAQPNANAQVLSAFKLPIPNHSTQIRISSILSAYDDLIANNRRRIHLLEQAARLLYKEWFVRLRFPGHEHAQIRDGVPEGWERKPLGAVAPLKYGKALKNEDRVPGLFPVYGSSGVVGTHTKPLVAGPTIIVGRKGNVGSVFWSPDACHPIDTVYYIDSERCSFFLYYALQLMNFISTDVAVPGLNRDFAHSRVLLLAERQVLRLFEETVSPWHRQMDVLKRQNAALAKARDLLLPKLMNGEVAV